MNIRTIIGLALVALAKLLDFLECFDEFNKKHPFWGSLAMLGSGAACMLFGAKIFEVGITMLGSIPILQMGVCFTGLPLMIFGLAVAVGGILGFFNSVVTLVKN